MNFLQPFNNIIFINISGEILLNGKINLFQNVLIFKGIPKLDIAESNCFQTVTNLYNSYTAS